MQPTHRYLVLIAPSASIADEVVRMRDRLYAQIGHFSGRLLMPHLTLFLADLPEDLGATVEEGVEAGVQDAQPFELHYAGITHFPDRRTIYIDPVEKDVMARLRGPLVEAVRRQEALRAHVRATFHPHLTIAAGLKPAQFEVAWPCWPRMRSPAGMPRARCCCCDERSGQGRCMRWCGSSPLAVELLRGVCSAALPFPPCTPCCGPWCLC